MNEPSDEQQLPFRYETSKVAQHMVIDESDSYYVISDTTILTRPRVRAIEKDRCKVAAITILR